MTRSLFAALLIGLLPACAALCGCTEKLEDGYEPSRLGATLEQRRTYYAAPYASDAGKDHDAGAPTIGPGH